MCILQILNKWVKQSLESNENVNYQSCKTLVRCNWEVEVERILNLWRRRKASFTRCWDLSYGIIVALLHRYWAHPTFSKKENLDLTFFWSQRLGMFHAAFSVPICFQHNLEDRNMPDKLLIQLIFQSMDFHQSVRKICSALGIQLHFPFQPTLTGVPLIGAEVIAVWFISIFVYLEVFCFWIMYWLGK